MASETHALRRRAKRAEKGGKTYSVHGKPMGRKPKSSSDPVGPAPAKSFPKGVVQNPNGRPTSFTEEFGERIVNLLWTGECKSITAVGRLPDMPTRRTILTWAKTYPAFGEDLYEARLALGDVFAQEIEDTKQKMLNGELDPQSASVAIKSDQWKAMISNPRDYSTKSYIEKNETKQVTHTHINRIDISQLSEEERDAVESALEKTLLLTGPGNGDDRIN